MILLPVIEREFRSAARQSLTYNLRVLGVLSLLVVLGMFWLKGQDGPGAAERLFVYFHRTLFFAIWLLVPLLTADCLSRERREGTLPLLFLTSLKPGDIVSAKGIVHGMRSFTLWLAVLPVFTVCLLGGGVGWDEVAISALVNFSSICLALGAGLVASARTRVWTRALAGAALLGFLFLGGFLCVLPWAASMYQGTPLARRFPMAGDIEATPGNGLAMAIDYDDMWQWWLTLFKSGPGLVLFSFGCAAALCVCALYLLFRWSARIVERTWQDRELSPRVIWMREKLFKPVVFRKQLHGLLRWQLQHNPIGWLEQRNWSGRLVVWSWLAIVICVYSSLFANLALYQRGFHTIQNILATLLAGSIAVCAAGSFRRERESGVLELILVSPLRERQIILDRLLGLWFQFLPSITLLCAVWVYGSTFLSDEAEMPAVLGSLVTFATLPLVGLYFSLAKPNFMASLAWTVLLQLVVPAGLVSLTHYELLDESGLGDLAVQATVQLATAAVLGWRLLVMLKRREFIPSVS
jgi:ABC-type transport system involved in multi-copper enzyme maturation permease subunit